MTEDRLLDIFTDSIDMNLSKLQEIVENKGDWHAKKVMLKIFQGRL